jgi:hypothetical protein
MDKTKLLKLIGELAQASTHHYAVVNGHNRGSTSKAADRELRAARTLALAVMPNYVSPATDEELQTALGW